MYARRFKDTVYPSFQRTWSAKCADRRLTSMPFIYIYMYLLNKGKMIDISVGVYRRIDGHGAYNVT